MTQPGTFQEYIWDFDLPLNVQYNGMLQFVFRNVVKNAWSSHLHHIHIIVTKLKCEESTWKINQEIPILNHLDLVQCPYTPRPPLPPAPAPAKKKSMTKWINMHVAVFGMWRAHVNDALWFCLFFSGVRGAVGWCCDQQSHEKSHLKPFFQMWYVNWSSRRDKRNKHSNGCSRIVWAFVLLMLTCTDGVHFTNQI